MKEHYLYLMSEGKDGPVKIGISGNPWARVMELQDGNSKRLHIVKAWSHPSRDVVLKRERFLHHFCRLNRLVGEWFDLSEAEALAIIEGGGHENDVPSEEIVDDGGWLDERVA